MKGFDFFLPPYPLMHASVHSYVTDSPVGSKVENCFTVPLLLSLPLSATSVAVRLAQAGRPGISREELGWGMD